MTYLDTLRAAFAIVYDTIEGLAVERNTVTPEQLIALILRSRVGLGSGSNRFGSLLDKTRRVLG